MVLRLRTISTLLCSLALVACATQHPAASIPRYVGQPVHQSRLIGKVMLVNEHTGFVLIDTPETFPVGTTLDARSVTGSSTASLRVSPEMKRPFIIADIVKGSPRPGDQVIVTAGQ